MSIQEEFEARNISLDEFVALNDEIAGLVRAGVPLNTGLANWGSDVGGPLGHLSRHLADAIERGESLSVAFEGTKATVPPVYRALVLAGLRSGRLPSALESLTKTARNLAAVRSAIGLAVLYPLLLVIIAYLLLMLLTTQVLPQLLLLYDGAPPRFWAWVVGVAKLLEIEIPIPATDLVILAGFLPPILLVLAAALWWWGTRRAMLMDMRSAARWLGWIPIAGRVAREARTASLAEVMALLVEHDVPLDESLVLAAECSGDRGMIRGARELAAAARAGSLGDARARAQLRAVFPPLLAWLISSGGSQQTMVAIARHVADTYRRRTLRDAQWLRDYLPMWLVVLVGGLVAAIYCLTLFVPFTQLMEALSGAVGGTMRIKP